MNSSGKLTSSENAVRAEEATAAQAATKLAIQDPAVTPCQKQTPPTEYLVTHTHPAGRDWTASDTYSGDTSGRGFALSKHRPFKQKSSTRSGRRVLHRTVADGRARYRPSRRLHKRKRVLPLLRNDARARFAFDIERHLCPLRARSELPLGGTQTAASVSFLGPRVRRLFSCVFRPVSWSFVRRRICAYVVTRAVSDTFLLRRFLHAEKAALSSRFDSGPAADISNMMLTKKKSVHFKRSERCLRPCACCTIRVH